MYTLIDGSSVSFEETREYENLKLLSNDKNNPGLNLTSKPMFWVNYLPFFKKIRSYSNKGEVTDVGS